MAGVGCGTFRGGRAVNGGYAEDAILFGAP
jgi:hypothetical protein